MMVFILLYAFNFLRTLAIILLFYYSFKLLMRYLAPKVVDKAAEKLFREANKRHQAGKSAKKDGEVTIEFEGKNPKAVKRDEGEYVEFEEVDE